MRKTVKKSNHNNLFLRTNPNYAKNRVVYICAVICVALCGFVTQINKLGAIWERNNNNDKKLTKP
jgi:hypothetical protein